MAAALARSAPPVAFVVAVGVGLLGTLALALVRFDAAVVVGFVLLAAVRVEPAPTDVVLGVTIAVAFVTGRFALGRAPRTALMLIGAFLMTNLLASINVADPGRAVAFFSTTLYLCVFALWVPTYVHSRHRAWLLVSAYLVAAVGSAALALAALQLPLPGRHLFVQGPRGVGLFKDPNVFGPFLIPGVLILVEELVTPRLLRWRAITKFAMLLLLGVGVLFSFSRAAWLNLAIGLSVVLLVLLLRRGGAVRALKLILVSTLAGAALAGTVGATQSVQYLHERAGRQSYDVERFQAQRLGLHVAETYPIGIGPGQFEKLPVISAHSTYVRTLAEEGIVGFVALIALFFATLYWAAGNVLRGATSNGIGSAALLAAWCGLLANGFFIDTIHWRHLWLVAGLIWAATPRLAARGRA
jgi:O-antigen ligase/polysaccharide polymerase Wzy-like membrane protein